MLALIGIGIAAELIATKVLVRPEATSFELSAAELLAGTWQTVTPEQAVETGKRVFPKCKAFAKTAGTGGSEPGDVVQKCLDRILSNDRPFAVNRNVSPASLVHLRKWWPSSVMGWSSASSRRPLRPCYFAASELEGTKGDPNVDRAGIITALFPPGRSPLTHSFQEVLDSGGFWLVQEINFGSEHPSGRDRAGKKVQLGPILGRMVTLSKKKAGEAVYKGAVERRFLYWEEEKLPSRKQRLELTASPQKFSEKELQKIAESLAGSTAVANASC